MESAVKEGASTPLPGVAAVESSAQTESYTVEGQESTTEPSDEGEEAAETDPHLVLFAALESIVCGTDLREELYDTLKDQPGGSSQICDAIDQGVSQMIATIVNHLPNEIERRKAIIHQAFHDLRVAASVMGDAVKAIESVVGDPEG